MEEIQPQEYDASNELEDMIDESSEVLLDDLPIDSLVVDVKKSLSVEQAQELIPNEALEVLKEKFNGHLENCRPIHDGDRLI